MRSIVNLGTITASNAGFAALVAPGVRNSGTISARLGTVALASANSFSLDFYGDQLITLAVNDEIAANVEGCRDRRAAAARWSRTKAACAPTADRCNSRPPPRARWWTASSTTPA